LSKELGLPIKGQVKEGTSLDAEIGSGMVFSDLPGAKEDVEAVC